ncbi:hypothetical protein [Actinomadura chokoriensis]|uniref:Uncharacterized protein n=1 Tax=Actinomadura chokoriensis TaxID=454156 RepID=A0ABV4R1B0_9ACTN
MTERGPLTGIGGAPNPAGPSHSGDAPAPAARPADLAAVRRTDALVEALAARRLPGAARPADDPDPAVRLLRALITDVDDQADEPAPPAPSGPGSRRRGPRTIVALGVAGAVLASTGVAAAGGGGVDRSSAAPVQRSSGAPGTPAASDVDAATHDRALPPARPGPGTSTARKPSRDRGDDGRLKRRLEHLLPPRHHHGRPDAPTMITQSTPSARPDLPTDDDPLRRLDDLRREAEKRANRYQNRQQPD